MTDIRIERERGLAILTIDRPHARNAIGLGTMDELGAALAALDDGETRCAVLTGAGDRAFVAGGDLRELETVQSREFAVDMAQRMRRVLDLIPRLPIPVIAAVNGAAIGGGAEVAIACDFRVMADDARIAFAQVRLGVTPAWGGIERLCGLVGRGRALYLLTTGAAVDGRTAERMGLVEECVPRIDFDARWRALAHQVAGAPLHALSALKRTVQAAAPGDHPHLEEGAVAGFARAWTDPEHWRMAAELDQARRDQRAGP